jgi:cytochrome P450
VRRGDRLLCSHFFTHRLAKSFPEPLRFRPERWQMAEPSVYEYMPYSVAPRLCIGAAFANSVLKRALSEIVRRHDFRLPGPTRIDSRVSVMLGPRSAVALEVGRPVGDFRSARVSGDFADFVELP